MKTTSIVGHYLQWMKAWPKAAGPKVTENELNAIHALGARAGAKATLAAAMYTRKEGASQAQVIQVVGGPQLNVISRLVGAGQAEKLPAPKNEQGHTVYRIRLVKGAKKVVVKEKAATAKGGQKGKTAQAAKKPRTKAPKTPVPSVHQEMPQTNKSGDGGAAPAGK